MNIIRAIVFTILVPGTIAVYVPRWLALMYPQSLNVGMFAYAGLVFMLAGFSFYFLSAATFLTEGGGTPAIWFTKPLKFLIGEEPGKFVRGKLYQFSRNPMYIGVVIFIAGEALWFDTRVLLTYAAIIWLCFHLVVVFVEEPHLRSKNGAPYEEYCNAVPRWIGFRRKVR